MEAGPSPQQAGLLDVWLPQDCGLKMGDRVEWVLRDLLTGEVFKRQETVRQVDLW